MSKQIVYSICLFLFLWMYEGISISYATDVERVMGVRHLGMAAFTAVADSGNAVIWNPAGLALIDRTELNIGGSKLLSDVYAGSMSVVGWPFDYGPFGFNVNYLDYGDDISRYDEKGNYIDSMKVVDKFFALSYGKEILQGLSIGGKVKGIWLERIGESEEWKVSFRGLSGDVGLLYRLHRQHNLLSFGIYAQDIPQFVYEFTKYEEEQTLSYPTIKTGIAANFGSLALGSLTVAADADFEIRKPLRSRHNFYPEIVSFGFEYCLKGGLDLRGGFSTSGFAWDKISFFGGLSIKTTSFGIDYAYSGHSILGFNHLGFDHNTVSIYIYGEAPRIFLKASQPMPADAQSNVIVAATIKNDEDSMFTIPADGQSSVTITATIKNTEDKVFARTRMVTFEVDDDSIGKLEGKNPRIIRTVDGKAEIKLWSTEKEGEVTITTSSPGLEENSLTVKTAMPPKSTVKTLPYTNSKSFIVDLTASDEGGSGLEGCVIQYKESKDGQDGEWTVWRKEYIPEKTNYWNTQVSFGEPIEIKEGHTYYFRTRAFDKADNWEKEHPDEGDTHTTVVNEAPIISVLSSLPDGSNNATQNISVAITDTVSGVNWKDAVMTINGTSLNDDVVIREIEKDRIIYPLTKPLPDGRYTVKIKTSDIAGNPSEESWTFNVVTTSPPVSIVERNQYLPRWSPDGQKYACIEVVGIDQWLTIYDAINQKQLVSIELNGLGQITAELFPPDSLTSAETRGLGLMRAPAGFSWASDSEHYVFINGKLSEGTSKDIKRYDLDLYIGNLKGEITQLTADAVAELYPKWSPNGQNIAYMHGSEIRIQEIAKAQDGTIKRTQDSPISILPEGSEKAMFPEWAPNSKKIAFSVYQNNDFEIFIYDIASGNFHRLTTTSHIREHHPVWAPDSEWLAFYSVQQDSQNPFSISIAKANFAPPIMNTISMEQFSEAATIDGYELQIADDVLPSALLGPSWMPSGRHIVYIRDSDDSIEVAEFNLNGIKKIQHLKLETGTTMNSDIQCAQNEAKLIFSCYAPAGGGIAYSNVDIHILTKQEI